jgi:hypothetical protein
VLGRFAERLPQHPEGGFTMIRTTALMALALAAGLPNSANADVLSFEDLVGNLKFFTQPYHGFSFGNNDVDTNPWFYTSQASIYYKPKTGVKYVATDYQLYGQAPFEATLPITSDTDFVFNGAWFTGGAQVRYDLFLNGALVHTSADSPELTAVPVYLASGYNGLVDAVVVRGTQGYYAMDDFTFNASLVPETSTGALLACGLLAMGFRLARRPRRQL